MVNKQELVRELSDINHCSRNCINNKEVITTEVCHDCQIYFLVCEIKLLTNELIRVKEGDLTAEEFNNLCHNLEKKGRPITREEHKKECDKYRNGLFGLEPVKANYDLDLLKIQVDSATNLVISALGFNPKSPINQAVEAASKCLVNFFSPLEITVKQIPTDEEVKKTLEEFQARGINIQPPINRD